MGIEWLHPPKLLGFELVSAFQNTMVSNCKTTLFYNSDELNYVSFITLNLELRPSKREWKRKKEKEVRSESSLIS